MKPPDLDAVQYRIEQLDLEPIKFKLVKELGYSVDQVQIIEKWYKRFLFLTFRYPEKPIVVAEVIDSFWHQHILDTRKYAEDCQQVFGEFLHHFPYFGLRGDEDQNALLEAYRESLVLMRQEYGETPDKELLDAVDDYMAGSTVPSLCSDCSSYWRNPAGPLEQRPRLADMRPA